MALPRDLVSQFEKLVDERVRRALMGSAFANSGMTITAPGQFEIDGTVTVTGDFIAQGKIDNDALTDPVVTAQGHDDAANFALSPAWSYPLSVSIPIPSGFTRALVQAIVGVNANNSTAGNDYLFGDIAIPAYGSALPGHVVGSGSVDAGLGGISWQATSVQLTGLSGSSFTVQGAVSTAFGSWAADSGNTANLDVTVIFTR